MRLLLYVVFFLSLSQLIACSSLSTPSTKTQNLSNGRGELYSWVETELIPYITEQFTTNPMLKGSSFIVVDLNGDNINSDIDQLTADIRERLRDRLLQERSVQLIWRPTQAPWKHHRSLKQVNCRDTADTAEIYLGIDISSSLARGTHLIRVRAIDKKENSLLSGFGLSWEGKLAVAQLAAFDTITVDEHLRGLRPYPFVSGEADLAAAYLSNNISCVLSMRNDQDDFVVYLDGDIDQSMGGLVFDLMENYLNQFNEVRITTSRANANVFISRKVRVITDDLITFWASTNFVKDGEKVRGAETETYFRTEKKNSSSLIQ